MVAESQPILEIHNLNQYFRDFKSVNAIRFTRFLKDINLTINKGETIGIVGESGCGKTTLGRCIVGLISTITGEIQFKGENITNLQNNNPTIDRKKIQMIFQNPRSSLNINLTVRELIEEAVQLTVSDQSEVQKEVNTLLSKMKLNGREDQYPYELSGGERRRVGLARMMAVKPEVIIADEPVSSLDVSIKGFIIQLIRNYQKEKNATLLFITHDIDLVYQICDRIIVMFAGRIVESYSSKEDNMSHHPYTKKLIRVARYFSNDNKAFSEEKLENGTKDECHKQVDSTPGCAYYYQCPLHETEGVSHRCTRRHPPFFRMEKQDHFIACYAFQPKGT